MSAGVDGGKGRGETIRVTTLDNGLRIATDRMAHVASLSLGVWIGAGARNETAPLHGASHLLEHMLFKGTERRSAFDIAAEIEAVGGHINAHTAREHTAYYAKVLAEHTPLAIDVLSDMVMNAALDEGELAREREVVLQEIGQARDTPDDIVFDHLQRAAFGDQPLGRPVLGTPESVRAISRDDLAGYRAARYRGGDMVIAAAGAVEHEAFVDRVAAAFAGIPEGRGTGHPPAAYRGGEHRETRALDQVHLTLGFPGLATTDPEFYAAAVLSGLFGGGMSSRLFQDLREERGLVYSVFTFASSYHETGLFGVYAGTGEAKLDELVPALCDQISRLPAGMEAAETERARAQLRAGLLMGRESTGARCEQLAHHLLTFGRPLTVEEMLAKVDAVDVDAARHVATRLLSGSPALAALGPIDRLAPLEALSRRLAA